MANVDILLKGFDGGAVRVLRRDRSYDLNPILTVVLAIQPQILMNMAAKRAFHGNGLLERFLFLLPESRLGYRTNDGPPIPANVAVAYQDLLQRLLALEPTMDRGREAEQLLGLEAMAAEAWTSFRAAVERELRPDGRLVEIRGWGGKLPGYTLRIAGLLHLASKPADQRAIDGETMDRAVAISSLLIEHALAAHQLMGGDEASADAKVLYDWLVRAGSPAFTRTECLRAYHGRFTQKKRLDAAPQVLIDRRIVSRRAREETRRPGRPAEICDVNPLIFDRKGGGV